MNLESQVAKNTKEFITNNNKRGMATVRVCGEEHNATADNGSATLFLVADNDLCYISDYKFKLIFNGGSDDAWENMPVSTPVVWGTRTWNSVQAFMMKYPIGSAIDVDGYKGCQCVDYANAFWIGQVNRQISCGGDNARGIWQRAREYNAGSEFDLSTAWEFIQPGDWIVWGGGEYGHIGMAVATPDGDTVKIWDQNGQNGTPWPMGGKSLAASEKNNTDFLGYFRYHW